MTAPFTAAAARAVTRAGRLAEKAGLDHALPEHLFQALLQEESRAAEILNDLGLTLSNLDSGSMQGLTEISGPESMASIENESLENVLFEAGQLVAHGTEIGTEHLLSALVKIESPLAEWLKQHGLNAETLQDRLDLGGDASMKPLDIDFEINWKQPPPEDNSDHAQQRERATPEPSDVLRILDAAANRCREGLRVLEDYVRFTLDDAHLTGLLKNCRHDLAEALKCVEQNRLLKSRDTVQDVGTAISTPAESDRASLRDVVQANFKRVEEAARTLEEFGKLISPAMGEAIERIRYRLYTLEKAVLSTDSNRQRLTGRNLYLLVTTELCNAGIEKVVRESVTAGVSIVQLREKSLADRELLELAKRVREWTRQADALFIMNDRPDLAVLADADGVHVGQEELSIHEARRIVGPDRLVGFSTHDIEQARQAVLDGADYLGVGPVFPSQTKRFAEYAGLEFVRQVAGEITLPWYAIGGITAENLQQVLAAGATRVAVTGAICAADDPRENTLRLSSLLKK